MFNEEINNKISILETNLEEANEIIQELQKNNQDNVEEI